MASEYGYVTLATLENYVGFDISGRQAEFTDAKVESMITLAERLINGYIGESLSGTIPDAIQSATLIIAARILHRRIDRDARVEYNDRDLIDGDVKGMLDRYIAKEQQDSVDLINTYTGRDPTYGWYFPW